MKHDFSGGDSLLHPKILRMFKTCAIFCLYCSFVYEELVRGFMNVMGMSSKLFVKVLVLSFCLQGCGKLKSDDQAGEDTSAAAPKVYSSNGSYLGKFMGFLNGAGVSFISPKGDIFAVYVNGYLTSISPDGVASPEGCRYTTADCSGTCYVSQYSLLKNSVFSDGVSYYRAPGFSAVYANLTTNSSRLGSEPYTCSVGSVTSPCAPVTETVTLPEGLNFPEMDFSIEY